MHENNNISILNRIYKTIVIHSITKPWYFIKP